MTDVRNLQGDVVAIYCADGVIVARYEYDAWGNHTYISGRLAEINPIRYRGYYFDNETQLYYLQSRYYCPQLRRFISPDVFLDTGVGILGTNVYIYCNNDPVNLYDPTGFSPERYNRLTRLPQVWDFHTLAIGNAARMGEQAMLESFFETFITNLFSFLELNMSNIRFNYNEDFGILSGRVTLHAHRRWVYGDLISFDFSLGRLSNLISYHENNVRRNAIGAITGHVRDGTITMGLAAIPKVGPFAAVGYGAYSVFRDMQRWSWLNSFGATLERAGRNNPADSTAVFIITRVRFPLS